MLSYDGLTHAFNELHKDMTSICLKYKALKVKAFFLKKEIDILKDKDEKQKIDEDEPQIENHQVNDLNTPI